MLSVYSMYDKMYKRSDAEHSIRCRFFRGVKIYAKAINYICQKAARKGGEKATFLASYLSVRL